MEKQSAFTQAMDAIEVAEKELIDAQTTGRVDELNQAHYKLQIAQDLLDNLDEETYFSEEQNNRIQHAKEHLRHLLETEISLQ